MDGWVGGFVHAVSVVCVQDLDVVVRRQSVPNHKRRGCLPRSVRPITHARNFQRRCNGCGAMFRAAHTKPNARHSLAVAANGESHLVAFRRVHSRHDGTQLLQRPLLLQANHEELLMAWRTLQRNTRAPLPLLLLFSFLCKCAEFQSPKQTKSLFSPHLANSLLQTAKQSR